MYKLYKYLDKVVGAYKEIDGMRVCFTFDNPANTDYQAYLEWVAAGNTPEPAEDA
jgi:hypothetical protein